MKKTLLVLSMFLAGCATDPRIVAFEAGKKQVNLDKRVLIECPELPVLKDSTDEETLKWIRTTGTAYKTCMTWKHELNRIVKDAFNTEAK